MTYTSFCIKVNKNLHISDFFCTFAHSFYWMCPILAHSSFFQYLSPKISASLVGDKCAISALLVHYYRRRIMGGTDGNNTKCSILC